MKLSRHYTVAAFNADYALFKLRYPSAVKYLEENTVKEKWARCHFVGDRYNLDTSNSVESINNVFKDARKYSLIPMLDTIMQKFSDWWNEHRKDAVSGSYGNKLVPLLENCLHDRCAIAEKMIVREVNSYELEYEVVGKDGKRSLVSLLAKSCSCRYFDIDKYPCVHGVAAFIYFKRHRYTGGEGWSSNQEFELHDLCSKYYWTELWALAYSRSLYVVPDMSAWIVPDYIKEMKIEPPKRIERRGRLKVNRLPSEGERRRKRTQNKRRKRQSMGFYRLLFGDCVDGGDAQ